MKKIIYPIIILSLFVPFNLSFSFFAQAEDGETELIIAPAPSDTIHFVMTVKWGNVQGEIEEKTESNFDGSISVSSNAAKVSLIRELRFEEHNDQFDQIISQENPVSWNSLIYGHWDGVRVLVSSPASDNITVNVTPGSVTKTAKELYEANAPIVQNVGNGKEILIKTHPSPSHSYIAKIIWGGLERPAYAANQDCELEISNLSASARANCLKLPQEDFSGALDLLSGGKMELVRTVRFDKKDSITAQSDDSISWTSNIQGGLDGILVKFILDKNISVDDKFILSFTEQEYQKDFSLLDIYHQGIIKEEVKSGYHVYLSLWQHPDRRLIRAENGYRVYMVEDGLKRHIPNPKVFEDQGLNWEEVVEVDDDEVEVLPEGDPLSYTEGTLIQGEGPEVYVVSNGQKRHILDPAVFNKFQYNWRQIIRVNNDELAIYPVGEPVNANSDYPDNSLVRVANQSTVYVVEGDKLKPITSPEAFDSNNYRWDRIKTISSNLKNQYQIANALQLGDGALVRDPSGKVYQISQGEKHWIRSSDDFNKAGLNWNKIISVSAQEINGLVQGEDILSDDIK